MKKLISIVTPCYNEEKVISHFIAAIQKMISDNTGYDFEVIIVDDGSSDNSVEIIKKTVEEDDHFKLIVLSRNFGHQLALSAGIEHCKGDALVMLDSDMQHPVEIIPELILNWENGYEVVSTKRMKTENAGIFKNLTASSFYFIFNLLSETKLPYGAADFCLLSKQVYTQLSNMKEHHRFLRGLVCWVGFKRTFIEYQAPERLAGESKYSLVKMIRLATDAIFSFSSTPLLIATRLGLMLILLGFLYALRNVYIYFHSEEVVTGWASTICVIIIIGGFQLLFLGLIGQYISRIFEEVKRRPNYIVREIVESKR